MRKTAGQPGSRLEIPARKDFECNYAERKNGKILLCQATQVAGAGSALMPALHCASCLNVKFMSGHRPYFRFSLRSLLVFVAVAAVACLWYRSHRAFQRSPSKSGGGGGYSAAGDPQHLRTRVYRDHDDRLVAVILLAFDELDVNGPRYTLKHGYSARDGGWLTLDGKDVVPQNKPHVFASGPFGQVVALELTAAETKALAGAQSSRQVQSLYREVIEPKFFQIEGRADEKGRQGVWTYRLKSGELYKVVTYADGLRHGMMQTYYRSGGEKSDQSFERGQPAGEWTLYDPAGGVMAIIDHERGTIDARPKDDRRVRHWFTQLNDEGGYQLFVDNSELRMPP